MAATYSYTVDWNNDGDFADTGEDITRRVIEAVTIVLGRDQARAFSPAQPATMDITVNNRSGDYSPENGSSPLAGNLKPGRAIRAQATLGTTYGLFYGFTDEFNVLPDRNDRKVQFSCRDAMSRLQDYTISTGLSAGIRTGAAIGAILDAIGWTGGRDLDAGATVIPFWWAEQEDAGTALQKVIASEGSPAAVYIDPGTGAFTFRDRHHRLTRSTSTSSQATFRASGTEPLFSEPVTYEAGWRDVINDVTIQVQERQPNAAPTAVWQSDETIFLGASASTTLFVQGSDPFKDAIAPVQDTDYTVRAGSVSSVTLSRTSGQSTIITVTAGGSGATITGLVLRATAIPVIRTVKVTASDSTSITDYGSRGLPDDLQPVWANRWDAQALASLYVLQRKQRLPILSIQVRGAANTTRLTQCLSRALSDRVTVTGAVDGLSGDFFIERIQHDIDGSQGGRVHTTTFGLEKAPSSPSSAFVLGTSTLGSGLLGY